MPRPSIPRPSAALSPRAAIVVASAIAILVYASALANGYAYDDLPIIVENELVHASGRLLDLLGAPYWQGDGILYRPLAMLTYWVDWRLGGGAPWVFHLQNILWHALATALVTWLALRWLPVSAAALSGILFAVHPVHVEAVANVIGRADVMATVGLLLVVGAAQSSARASDASRGALILLLSFLSVCAKEVGAVAPVLAWAAALAHGRNGRDALRLAGASAAGVLLALALRVAVLGAVAQHPAHPAFASTSWGQGLLLALATLPRAVVRMLLPVLPAPDHSPTLAEIASPSWALVAAGCGLIALGAWALWRHARQPTLITLAIIIAALTFAPVSNIVLRTGVVLGERTLYAPTVGAMLLLGAGARAAWSRARGGVLVASAAWLGMAITMCVGAIPIWRSTEAVIAAMVERAPRSYWGHYHMGRRLLTRGDLEGADAAFSAARALFPNDPNLALDAATLALRRNDRPTALARASEATRLAPGNERARALETALRARAR